MLFFKEYFLVSVDVEVTETGHEPYRVFENRLVKTYDNHNKERVIDSIIENYYKNKSNDEIKYEVFDTSIIETLEG